MDKYEDQPADALLRDLFDLGRKTTWTVDDQIEYDEDVAAIKIAVIREAKGIAFHIENHETARNEYGAWTEKRVNGHVEPRGSSFQMIPPGDYVLISKETP